MPYAQIHTQAIRHRKVLSLSAPAFRLWVAGHCYCQEHLTDGEIPKVALVALGVPVKPAWVAELLAQALWHEGGDGYTVHDWTDWNATREQVETRRKTARERKAAWAAKRATDAHEDGAGNAVRNAVTDAVITDVRNAVRNGSDTQRNATQKNKIKIKSMSADADPPAPATDGFAAFWDAYPRHENRAKAEKAWKALRPSPALQEIILAAIAAQKTWRQWREGYIPHPTTWLHGKRWDDERPLDDRPPANRAPTGPSAPWCDHDPPCRHQQEHIQRLVNDRQQAEVAHG